MREIKFRSWCDKDKKFVNPTYNNAELNDIFQLTFYNLQQYTGLKDKNGIEIYEGDILNSNYFKNGLVVFWRSGWHLNTGKDCHHSFNTSIHSFEIIGNIHENKKL